MSPRKTAEDDFDELCYSSDDRDSGKDRKRQKLSNARKKKKKTIASRSEYEFDTDYYDDDDYMPDYDVDDWKVSYNPPYSR